MISLKATLTKPWPERLCSAPVPLSFARQPHFHPFQSLWVRLISKHTAASAGADAGDENRRPEMLLWAQQVPGKTGAAAPAATEIVFRYPIVRPTIFFVGTCCEIVQKFEFPMPVAHMAKVRMGSAQERLGATSSSRMAAVPAYPSAANHKRAGKTPIRAATRSAAKPPITFATAMVNNAIETTRPISRTENPRERIR